MNIKREHTQAWDYDTGMELIDYTSQRFYKKGSSSETSTPIIEPTVQNATFEAGEDDEDLITKKKKGKSSLVVEKTGSSIVDKKGTTPNVSKSSSTSSGLSVGA